ncbi:hypothetical protein DRO33_02710 [Candidatus Bathyarchaeota archaeon]|nr:MAG: hypothetical protein DRO33_02710 [Candidatus Bathyarchaeota archaeon]
MAVVAPAAPPAERPGTGLLLAGWILGLLAFFGYLAWLFVYMIWPMMYAGGIWLWVLFLPELAWLTVFSLIWTILCLVGTILTFMAWSKAKRGESPGALGIVGGVLLLLTSVIAGILAIIGASQAK